MRIQATAPQAEFMSLEKKYKGFFGGYGTGKSETLANCAIIDALAHPAALIGIYEPTYDLIRLIIAPRIQSKLAEYGIRFKYNKSENIIYTSSGAIGDFIFRTLDNPERIVGYETYRSHIDELDILNKKKAEEAWNKIVARNRQSLKYSPKETALENRVSAYSTPEGFKFCHERWIVKGGKDYGHVQASTLSNPFLPEDYVQALRDTYPDELIEAYINGLFVNLTSGTVYNSFDRVACHSDEVLQEKEMIRIGMDFNVGNMSAVIYNTNWVACEELHGIYDTPEMIRIILEKYENRKIIVYPDATGKNRKSNNASSSDISLIRSAGLEVRAKESNPRVKDRILASNQAFEQGRVKVNTKQCPEFTRCLEQLAYDKNGEPDKNSDLDHLPDAGTYPIAFEMPILKPVIHIPVHFAV